MLRARLDKEIGGGAALAEEEPLQASGAQSARSCRKNERCDACARTIIMMDYWNRWQAEALLG